MLSTRNEFIHEKSAEEISIILTKTWQVENQSISSAITNSNDLPEPDLAYTQSDENTAGTNAFADINFGTKTTRMLDLGGGKYDVNIHFMKKKNIELLVWDPFNRSKEHNLQIQQSVSAQKVDAATSMSVLNVIPELEVRLIHINTLKFALAMAGKAYFKIWPGENELKGSYHPTETQSYFQANAYADRFMREIEIVFGQGHVQISEAIPNLIIATKTSTTNTSLQEIIALQNKSAQEFSYFQSRKSEAFNSLYTHSLRLFSANMKELSKLTDTMIEENRHHDPVLQHEYDIRHGLIIL